MRLQYELCEVPVVHTPDLDRLSLVVLDGPFVSIAPYGKGRHILSDVVHSVHTRSVGHERPDFTNFDMEGTWSSGMSAGTRFGPILSSARRFVESLGSVVHLGSLVAERVVLPGVDQTDARPTVASWASPNVISILSGKVSTSVDTGRLVARAIASRVGDDPADTSLLPVRSADGTIGAMPSTGFDAPHC
jgi:hypothetical protein